MSYSEQQRKGRQVVASISVEACVALSVLKERDAQGLALYVDPDAPGWVTDGCFMACVGEQRHEKAGLRDGDPPRIGELLRRLRALPQTPLRERPELRLPVRHERCDACGGSGREMDEEAGGSTECEWCEGVGEVKSDYGQVVLVDAAGVATVASPHYWPLLEGLRVSRLEDDRDVVVQQRPIGGFAEDGSLVVALMPMRAEVRTDIAAELVKQVAKELGP